MTTTEKKAVILLAFGGADSLDNVEPFIKNILKRKELGQDFIDKIRERYRVIGGKSPLLDITLAQAKALETALNSEGDCYKVYVGMRYWHPYIKDTISQMKADGFTKATGFIMSPFTSFMATGGYLTDIEEALKPLGGAPRIQLLSNWHIHEDFISCVVDNIKAALASFQKKEDALVIFSNHSLPLAALEGDAYEMKVIQSVDEIIKAFPIDYKIGYQSQGAANPLNWLGPKTENVIDSAKAMGKKGVIVVPLGFVADHIETLYDIDVMFKGYAESKGLIFERTPSLNTNAKFIGMLAGLINKFGGGGQPAY